MAIEAIIWDMDGTISDTQHLHATIESELLARFGIFFSPEEITRRYAGVRTADFFQELLNKKGTTYNIDELIAEKWRRATESVNQVKAIPWVLEIIKEAYKRNILQAVASASGKEYVNAVIDKLGLKKYFKTIISGDQVIKGKPDSEIFLKAAKTLNALPSKCVVIEDGKSGMIGAKNAGMKCVGYVKDSGEYPADIKIDDFEKLSLNYILSLWKIFF
jgi:HAD superfamily hydrolase (TIGR01549 family)